MAIIWRLVGRTADTAMLAADEATLVIESSRPAHDDPNLDRAIARLAPHLAFAPATSRGNRVERTATSSDERVVVGHLVIGATSVAYLLTARDLVDIDGVLAEHFAEIESPFAHVAD